MHTQLADALTPYLDNPQHTAAYKAALSAYAKDPHDTTKREALWATIDTYEPMMKPITAILQSAWVKAIKTAEAQNSLNPHDEGDGMTVFGEVWGALCTNGWKSLPDYRHEQLSEALALTLRNTLEARNTLSAQDLATLLLDEINTGTFASTHGGDDFFTNWADGSHLCLEMNAWTPILRNKDGKLPKKGTKGIVFHNTLAFPSGKALVSDTIALDPVPELLEAVRSAFNISINYDWPRVNRTGHSANLFNIIDISVGSDGPGLVQANPKAPIFGAAQDDTHPSIASICHDYWGTQMIDRGRLAKMMVKKSSELTLEQAEQAIDAWLAQSRYHTQVTVPEIVHFYWDDDSESLDKALEKAGIEKPEDCRFVLSFNPLLPPEDVHNLDT